MHVQLALSTISDDHVTLKRGLQTMLQSHISPDIITNTLLLALLKEISVQTTGLLFPPTPEFLGMHRAAIRVVPKMTALQGLNFYLLIPLRGNPADTFDVFRMDSLPYPIPSTDSFIVYQPSKNYLVISEGRTSYFLMDKLDVCNRHDALLICPPLGPIYASTIATCEVAIFLQKESVEKLCQKYVLKEFPPVFIRGDKSWTFATSKDIDITVNCINNTNMQTMRHTISGTGILEVGPGCSVHSNAFSLPGFSPIMKKKTVVITPYPYSMPLTFTPWEHAFLMNATNLSLPSSDGLTPVPLHDFIGRLQPLMKTPAVPDQELPEWLTIMKTIGIVLLLLAIMLGGRLLRSWWIKRRLSIPTQPTEADPVHSNPPATCPHVRGARGRAPVGEGSLS